MAKFVDEFLEGKSESGGAAPEQPESTPKPAAEAEAQAPEDYNLLSHVIEVLHTIYDPEIPVDIYELGLIYKVRADVEGKVAIEMTLTTPNCPVADSMPEEIKQAVKSLPGVEDVKIEIVFDPIWSPDMMSEAARLELGFM